MKQNYVLLALLLCLIAVGGLAVLFRETDTSDSSGSGVEIPVRGITVENGNLVF